MEISDWLRAIDEQTDIGGKLRILSNWTEQSNRRFSVPLAQIPVKSCNEVRQSSVGVDVDVDVGVDGLVAPQPESNNDLTTTVIQPTEELEDEDTDNGESDHQLKPKTIIEKVNVSASDSITPINNVLINQVDIGVIDCSSNSLKCNINEKVSYVRKLFDRMNVKNLILRSGENILDPGINISMKHVSQLEDDVTKVSLMEGMVSIRNWDPGLCPCYLDVYGAAGIITQMDCLINNTDVLETTSYANDNELSTGLVTLHFFRFVFRLGSGVNLIDYAIFKNINNHEMVSNRGYSAYEVAMVTLRFSLYGVAIAVGATATSNTRKPILMSLLQGGNFVAQKQPQIAYVEFYGDMIHIWHMYCAWWDLTTRGFVYLQEDSQSCVIHGDFKERVKILENTSHLPLNGELGDNVSHLSKKKTLSLMIPSTSVINNNDWPLLRVIEGIFEGRLDNIRKADMGEDEGTVDFARQVIQATERNMNDVDELNYDFRNPFVTCGEGDFLAASTQVISCSSC